MRIIIHALPVDDYNKCRCILCRDGKYSTVIYSFDGIVSKVEGSKVEGVGLWDYNALVNHGNKWLLEKL